MTRIGIPVLMMLLAACASGPKTARESDVTDPKQGTVTIHPDIDETVTIGRLSVAHTDDGRMQIQMLLVNEKSAHLPLIIRTDWLDDAGWMVSQSDWKHVQLPGATTTYYDAASMSAKATHFAVHVRPASQERE